MINYLYAEESQETIFKISFFAFSAFFLQSLKEIRLLSIYVDACDECQMREVAWFREEEGEIKSKRRKASELLGCEVNVVPC